MKNWFIILGLALCTIQLSAQKIALVDTDYILNQMPEYSEAQKELDKTADKWRKEMDKKRQEVDKMFRDYQAEQVLLTDDLRKKREEAIVAREKELKEFQKQRFGYQGELFKKRQELVKPIQDKIYAEIEKLAEQRAYDIILDKASGAAVLFSNPKLDKSSTILKALGIKADDK